MSQTIAKVTVSLPSEVSGEQVMNAIAAVIEQHAGESVPPSFIKRRYYVDGTVYKVGQQSGFPARQLRVKPTKPRNGYIRDDGVYDKLVVVNYDWSGTAPAPESLPQQRIDEVIDAVGAFARELEAALRA